MSSLSFKGQSDTSVDPIQSSGSSRGLALSDFYAEPKSGQPHKSLSYIIQTILRITLINRVMGKMEGKEAACGGKKAKQKSNEYFISF